MTVESNGFTLFCVQYIPIASAFECLGCSSENLNRTGSDYLYRIDKDFSEEDIMLVDCERLRSQIEYECTWNFPFYVQPIQEMREGKMEILILSNPCI